MASNTQTTKQWQLTSSITGMPTPEHFALIDAELPAPSDAGSVTLRTLYTSVDPYLRGIFRNESAGFVPVSAAVVRVEASTIDGVEVGAVYVGHLPWQLVHVLDADALAQCHPVDEARVQPVSLALGVLGVPGQTAFHGLFDVGELRAGQTVLVSGGAGAVGSVAGQIAKQLGCRVVATAGSAEKLAWMRDDLGFDAVINYKDHKTVESMQEALKAAAPDGINVYFDNTGGVTTDATWDVLSRRARVVVCGQIAYYNRIDTGEDIRVPLFLHKLIYNEVRVEGIYITTYFTAEARGRFYEHVTPLVASGSVVGRETVVDGFDQMTEAFIGLFSGKNTGKMVVKA